MRYTIDMFCFFWNKIKGKRYMFILCIYIFVNETESVDKQCKFDLFMKKLRSLVWGGMIYTLFMYLIKRRPHKAAVPRVARRVAVGHNVDGSLRQACRVFWMTVHGVRTERTGASRELPLYWWCRGGRDKGFVIYLFICLIIYLIIYLFIYTNITTPVREACMATVL